MRYLSVCSGIEAFSVAVDGMGWTPAGFAEIEPFPCHVLAHRLDATPPMRLPPGKPTRPFRRMIGGSAPNYGDFTQIDPRELGAVDWLVGGTPCQSFSFAGLRGGLDDSRGNLTLEFVRLAREMQDGNGLAGLLWENVPGVLSDKTNAFGCFLAGLVGHDEPLVSPFGKRWPDAGMVAGPRARLAWRVLDSQHLGVPQRRRRVYVVEDTGGGRFDPAAVLFEPKGMPWDSSPRRQTPQDVTGTLGARTKGCGGFGADFDLDGGVIASTGDVAHCLNAGSMGRIDYETETMITHTLRGNIRAGAGASSRSYIASSAVRRLTPTECERLQGFPDGWTDVPYGTRNRTPDGPRYKSLGNSFTTNTIRWIMRRVNASLAGTPMP